MARLSFFAFRLMMKTELIEYTHNGTLLEGFLCYQSDKKLPGVILCHAWSGRDDFVCKQAKKIADWGYSTFALDLYGKGILGSSKEENMSLMLPFIQDRSLLKNRLLHCLNTFQDTGVADNSKIASIGFCFGGLCALDYARSGAQIKGSVSVHGLLSAPDNHYPERIKSKILALHGHDDPMVRSEDVLEFEKEMTQAGADWQIHIYGNTMHAFTNPMANDPDFGTVYNSIAAKRAWLAARNFFEEIF